MYDMSFAICFGIVLISVLISFVLFSIGYWIISKVKE